MLPRAQSGPFISGRRINSQGKELSLRVPNLIRTHSCANARRGDILGDSRVRRLFYFHQAEGSDAITV